VCAVSLLRDLKHANIVTLHDIIHTDSCLTLVFEYLVRICGYLVFVLVRSVCILYAVNSSQCFTCTLLVFGSAQCSVVEALGACFLFLFF